MNFISSKINIVRILKKHISTLQHLGRTNKADIWTFYIIPCVISLVLTIKVEISDSFIELLGVILSIFIGLFLNLLMLLISYAPPENIENSRRELLVTAKKETFYNVSYIILLCILELLCLLVFIYIKELVYISNILSFIIYALTIHIFLILLMILKRIFSIYDNTM